jgi:hypothetical protein
MNTKVRRASLPIILVMPAVAVLMCCGSGHTGKWSSRARTMALTSGPSETVVSSSNVPGYWARETSGGEEFFLSTSTRSYRAGDWVTVEGPFGSAYPAMFRDETGEYRKSSFPGPVNVLVVWKIGRSLSPAVDLAESRPRALLPGQNMTIVSDALFVRTGQGDYVDGYLAEYYTDFRRERMFIVMEIARYLKGERLKVIGEFTGDSVRITLEDQEQEKVPVFLVERAAPNIPQAAQIPRLK